MTDIKDAHVKSRFEKSDYLLSPLKHLYSLLDKFISFLTISSLFIAINATLVAYISFLLYGVSVDLGLLLAAFFVTFTVYALNKLTDLKEDAINMPGRAGFIEKNKHCLICAVIASFIAALFISFSKSPFAVFIVLFPFCIGVVYSVKISNFRLKDITGVKNIVVALSWAVMEAFLPLAVSAPTFILTILIFYFIFTKILISATVFDVRDIEGDRLNNVRTIPVVLGREKTKNLLLILNSTLLAWLVLSYLLGFFHRYILVLIFSIIYGYGYIIHFCRDEVKAGKSLELFGDGEWIPVVILCLVMQFVLLPC